MRTYGKHCKQIFVLNLVESSVSGQTPENPRSLSDTLNLTMILPDIADLLTDWVSDLYFPQQWENSYEEKQMYPKLLLELERRPPRRLLAAVEKTVSSLDAAVEMKNSQLPLHTESCLNSARDSWVNIWTCHVPSHSGCQSSTITWSNITTEVYWLNTFPLFSKRTNAHRVHLHIYCMSIFCLAVTDFRFALLTRQMFISDCLFNHKVAPRSGTTCHERDAIDDGLMA